MKIFVYHRNAHQKETLAEKDLNNQGAEVSSSVSTSQPLSPAIPVIVQLSNGLVNTVANDGRDRGQAWLTTWTSTH